jgi:hypothetical protein
MPGPEATFEFTAPTADLYRFRVTGTPVIPAIEVRNLNCAGPVLDCDVAVFPMQDVSVDVPLGQNQTVVIVVELDLPENFTLDIDFAP